MKAIILAAGRGTRLNKYTQDLPKGMLHVFDKPIIQHQIETYIRNGIKDITIVKGYCAEKINFPETKSFTNDLYAETNMVESLFCAEGEINGDLIISYSDILFEDKVLQSAMTFNEDVGVVIDKDWKDYWKARYDKVDFDTESLRIDNNGKISELGISDPPLDEIDGRYVGMIRLSEKGSEIFRTNYYRGKELYSAKPWLNGRLFEQIYMTDFLQELINQDKSIYPILINRGWLEFDTNEDYERVLKLDSENNLAQFYKI